MWHICITPFSLIRICWLKVNEINSSWWHWIRLLSCLNALHTVDSLITCSQSHTFVSTNAQAPFFFSCWLSVIRQFFFFSCQKTDSQKSSLNYLSISGFTIFALGAFLRLAPACGCLGFTPLSPLLLHLSCRQRILIEAWLSDNL